MSAMTIKPKYALLGGRCFHSGGGWHDYKGGFESVAAAKLAINRHWDFWHIVDLETQTIEEWDGVSYGADGMGPEPT